MTKLMMMRITTREGNFTRSSIYEVDEKEVFRGDYDDCGDYGGGDNDKADDGGGHGHDDGGGDKNDLPGEENSLAMRQTYTHRFQCRYLLHRYPFDTQVLTHIHRTEMMSFSTQECEVLMVMGILDIATVSLIPHELAMRQNVLLSSQLSFLASFVSYHYH